MTEKIGGQWYAVSILTGKRHGPCANRKHAEMMASSFRRKASEVR